MLIESQTIQYFHNERQAIHASKAAELASSASVATVLDWKFIKHQQR